MSRNPKKTVKRKAKLKARKIHAEQEKLMLAGRIAEAIMDLCAGVMPEYADDSRGPDLVGRGVLWRMGVTAWNIAVTGRREIDETSIRKMNLDEESRNMVRNEINGLIRRKYAEYPDLRTSVVGTRFVVVSGVPRLKVSLGETFPKFPIPDFDDVPQTLTPEEILAKRKAAGLSQVKFAAELGVSVKKVSAWEHGKAVPDEAEMEKIRRISR